MSTKRPGPTKAPADAAAQSEKQWNGLHVSHCICIHVIVANCKKNKLFYFADFTYRGSCSERNPRDKRGITVLKFPLFNPYLLLEPLQKIFILRTLGSLDRWHLRLSWHQLEILAGNLNCNFNKMVWNQKLLLIKLFHCQRRCSIPKMIVAQLLCRRLRAFYALVYS